MYVMMANRYVFLRYIIHFTSKKTCVKLRFNQSLVSSNDKFLIIRFWYYLLYTHTALPAHRYRHVIKGLKVYIKFYHLKNDITH